MNMSVANVEIKTMKDKDLFKIIYALEIDSEPLQERRVEMRKNGFKNIPRRYLEQKWKERMDDPVYRNRAEEIYAQYLVHTSATGTKDGKLPGIVHQGIGLTKAIVAESVAVLSGKEAIDDQTLQNRLAICGECPKLSGKGNFRCLECGCYMKVKAKLRSQKCPLKKW